MKDFIYKGVLFKAKGHTYHSNIRGFDYILKANPLLRQTARQSARSFLDYVLLLPPSKVFFGSSFKHNNTLLGKLTRKSRYRYWLRHYEKYRDFTNFPPAL